MMNIKNINVKLENIIPNFTKRLKLITNNMYYTSTIVLMYIFILPSSKNNGVNFNGDVIYSKTCIPNIAKFSISSPMDFELKVGESVKVEIEEIEEIEEKIEVETEEDKKENLLDIMPELKINNESVYYREAKAYEYTDEEFEQICKIAYLEAGGTTEEERYIDAMAVVSVILNRIEDERWCTLGSTPLEQIYAENQFSSLTASLDLSYDEVPDYIRNAVADCLDGIRNNDYVSFRAKENSDKNRVQLVNQGNNYFEKMHETEVVLTKK